ncbi:hypothetical protein [Victivallis vadensis]|uniref:hypothetical protein n=1 Tax=Victivallis vadensis TaxID=172901 RepID=UPI0023F9E5E5|nr:hypothetical protein [Victivallis vadensis]
MRRCFRRFSGFWRLRGRCRGGKSAKGLINLSRSNIRKQMMSSPPLKSAIQRYWNCWAIKPMGNCRIAVEKANRPIRVIF